MPKNKVRQLRESMLMSKAELARKAGLSALTIDRVEKGNPCRMDTKRKILMALGMKLSERDDVFYEDDELLLVSDQDHQEEESGDDASHEVEASISSAMRRMMTEAGHTRK